MSLPRRARALLKLVFDRQSVETDLDAEVQSFYRITVDRYVEQGHSEEEARRLAHLQLGHIEQVKEEVRDTRTGATVSAILRDVSLAFRRMRKTPSVAWITILTLALGIGAN